MTDDEDVASNFEILADVRALTPEKEGDLTFQGHSIHTATLPGGQGFVVLRSLCDAFGLNFSGQRQRLNRTNVFRSYSTLIRVTTRTGLQPQLCLSAFAVPAFLMGVETGRVASEETRLLLDAFQEEGMIVLAEHFGISERGEIRFLRDSINRMTAAQEAFEAQIITNVEKELATERASREEKVQQIRDAFANLRQQIHVIERVAGPKLRISPEQIGQLKQTVMVLGEMMIRAGHSTRPWPAIYTDITLQFGFARTEDITQEKLPDVLDFLDRQVQAFRARLKDRKSVV